MPNVMPNATSRRGRKRSAAASDMENPEVMETRVRASTKPPSPMAPDEEVMSAQTFEFRGDDPKLQFELAAALVVKDSELGKIHAKISEETLKRLRGDLVRLLLLRSSRRLAITRDDLRQELMGSDAQKNIRGVRGLLNFLLLRAHEYLTQVFGYGIVEGGWVDKKFGGMFFLVNSLPDPEDGSHVSHLQAVQHGTGDRAAIAEKGTLLAALALALHAGQDGIAEEVLYEHLRSVDTSGRTKKLRDIGLRLPQLLDAWSRQKYLIKEKKDFHGDSMNHYTLGPRAIAEVGRPSILSFVFGLQGQRVDERMLDAIREEAMGDEDPAD